MTSFSFRAALAAAALATPLASARAQAPNPRRNAVTEAVAGTRKSIISLTVIKDDDYQSRRISGSGLIVDESGFAVTNHHVIADASRIEVTFWDQTTALATVHKFLPRSDLAILKLAPRDDSQGPKYRAITLAPTADLMRGETVIAVGNPHGYAGTVSAGIISALGRDVAMPSGAVLTGLIQHSAGINPGNSGGALLNVNGELIGVNVALHEGSQGIAFAINADTVKAALCKHLSAARVSQVSHGLDCAEKVVGESGDRQQVVVSKVVRPAGSRLAGRKAPLGEVKAGDVILAVGKTPLQNRFDLERSLWGYKAGDVVPATVLRGGKKATVAITLTAADH